MKNEIQIAFASDLHLEFPNANRRALVFPENVDVIVLAGDIEVGDKAANEAIELSILYPSAHIVWVAGNHEFYDRNIDKQIAKYRTICADHDRVHFLENESVEINGITFLGCTLWTDFSLFGEAKKSMDIAGRGITDFALIRTKENQRFKPQDAALRFAKSREFLEQNLLVSNHQRTVVVTHFPPGFGTRNVAFDPDAITPYFQANINTTIDTYQPALWIYGHNHYSNDFYRGSTRLVSNQLGYPSEAGRIPNYDARKTIVLTHDQER